MFILAFSLDWFTTIPGILISIGVVLLIVAIILFATGNKKDKTKVTSTNIETKSDIDMQVENTVTPVEPVAAVESQPIVESVQVGEQPKFEDIPMGMPGVDPINSMDTIVGLEENKEVVEVPTEIKIEEPVSIEVNSEVTPEVSVYGGTNPTDSIQSVSIEEDKKPTIYGGNDPLEATQSLPKVEEHHEPYGGAISEVKIIEPVEEPVVELPDVEAEPIQVEIPSVEEAPVSFEIPAVPVEIPSESVEIPAVVSEEVEESTVEPVVEPVSQPVIEEITPEKPIIEEL